MFLNTTQPRAHSALVLVYIAHCVKVWALPKLSQPLFFGGLLPWESEMFHRLVDERVKCTSIMTEMRAKDYVQLVDAVYEDNGGLEGQRGPLKTKTAITIRKRMIADIRARAVLPPLVLGVLASEPEMGAIEKVNDADSFINLFKGEGLKKISVIDGMQRTTAIIDAIKEDQSVGNMMIRVEFWVSSYINSLVYRMLVLNTGQVPWELGRQLETIYNQFLVKIKEELKDSAEIFARDDTRRRYRAAQYQSKEIVELLLLFSSRKSELDIKDKVAEDFARLDAIESTSHGEFIDYFIRSLKLMTELDRALSRFEPSLDLAARLSRIRTGKDIFASFPAMAGFCAALSVSLFDEPGFLIEWDKVPERMATIASATEDLITRINEMPGDALESFLQVELLEQKLSQKSGQVGRFEREFFKSAFESLFKNARRLTDMAPCWMAR